MGKDNLTNGPMARHFRALALPAAFGMLFATLYNIVDVYYAGLLSTDAQAGLAIGYQAISGHCGLAFIDRDLVWLFLSGLLFHT